MLVQGTRFGALRAEIGFTPEMVLVRNASPEVMVKVLEATWPVAIVAAGESRALSFTAPPAERGRVLEEIAFYDTVGIRTRVFALRNVSPADVQTVLNARFQSQGLQISTERANNAMIATGRGVLLAEVALLIREIDREIEGAVEEQELRDAHIVSRAYWLRYLDAADIADQIRQHYKPLNSKYHATPDTRRNLVWVTASLRIHEQIEAMMKEIDVPDSLSRELAQTRSFPVYYRALADVSKIVTEHFRPRKLDQDASGRAVVVTAAPTLLDSIGEFLTGFDRRPPTIIVEGTILQVNLSKAQQVGVRQTSRFQRTVRNTQVRTTTTQQNTSADFLQSALTSAFPIPNVNYEFTTPGGRVYSVSLGALINEGAAEIVLKPHITFISGGEGNFEQTSNIPNVSVSQNGTNVNFVKAGLGLRVGGVAVPTAIEGESGVRYAIALNKLRIQDGRVGNQVTSGGGQNIAFFTTDVLFESPQIVDDGQLIIVGGSINRDVRRTITRVPILGDIPIIKMLFRGSDIQDNTTELLGLLRISVYDENTDEYKASQYRVSKPLRPIEFGGGVNDSIHEHPLKTAMWSSVIIYEPEGGFFERLYQKFNDDQMKGYDRLFKSKIRARIQLVQEWGNLNLVKDLILHDQGLKQAFVDLQTETGIAPWDMLLITRHMGSINDATFIIYKDFLEKNGLMGAARPAR